METMLVRLKPRDARRKHVLRRYAYAGIHFHEARGWYRVSAEIAEYLRGVRQMEFDLYSPAAFDVCTEDEAQAIDAREREAAGTRRTAMDAVPMSVPRPGASTVTTADLGASRGELEPDEAAPPRGAKRSAK